MWRCFTLSVAIASSFLVSGTAAFDPNQAKLSNMKAPDLVHSTDGGQHVLGARLLRARDEERGFDLGIKRLADKLHAKKLAKSIMADPSKAEAAYRDWESKKYTLTDISNFLKVADPKTKGKYDQIYNGYMVHLDLTA
ncbi:Inactive elicitor Avr1b [Phytophthora megakarya]|uniref:RxLR effector protein n=1 Tax=Phytophthora megakarya TaxID=4795 RepID=A0A225VFG2_9STRA|nr:Inactive elicitor Avr1b [Phytophthora megakarya]